MNKKLALLGVAVLSAGILFAGCGNKDKKAASDAAWKPTKDVKVIVAYKAGSGTDTGARLLTNSAKKYVGQTLVIENKPGADGKIGWTELAKSKPDGQTIGFINLPTYTTLAQMEGSAFTDKSIVPICNHLTETAVVVVKKDAKWNSLKELVADAQANPGQLKCSTNGVQASNHTAAQLLAQLKVLGVYAEKRDPQLPDVPTLGELGYYNKWYGSARALVAPKGTPDNVIKFYEDAFKKTMEDPEVKKAHENAGMVIDFKDSKALGQMIAEQMDFCKNVVSKLYAK